MISKIKYKRVLLKLSGEALLGNNSHGIDEKIIAFLADEINAINIDEITPMEALRILNDIKKKYSI